MTSNPEFVYKRLADVSYNTMQKFLNSLTIETKTWREFEADEKGNRFFPITAIGYAVFDKSKPNEMIAFGYIYLMRSYSRASEVPTANVGMVVKRNYQGMKIGQRLHELLENLAREKGIKRFFATQDCDNNPAEHNVLKRGWKIIERIQHVQKDLE